MITESLEINAPVAVVYQVISNFKDYPDFVPGVKAVQVKSKGKTLIVNFKVEVIKEISYTIQVELKEGLGLSWTLLEGELMKKNSGEWNLSSAGPEKTHAIYSIDVGFGWLVPKTIVDQLTRTQLPEMLAAFKSRAEQMVASA